MVPIPKALYNRLVYLGIIDPTGVRDHNEGKSNYANGRLIQPWAIWLDWELKPWDADIVKRIGREKEEDGLTLKEQRRLDYLKIRHTVDERIRQLDLEIEQERRVWLDE